MKKTTILIILITLITPLTAADQVFHLELTVHSNDTAELESITTFEGQETKYYGEKGEYSFQLIENNSKKIWEQNRSINWMLMTNPPTPINTTPVSLNIPYSKSAEGFKLEKENKSLLNVDLAGHLCKNGDNKCTSFCDGKGLDSDCTCGDGICQESSNEKKTCPEDCSEPESEEEEEQTNQENRTSDGTEEVVDSSYSNYLIILIVVIATIIGLFMLSGKVKIEA